MNTVMKETNSKPPPPELLSDENSLKYSFMTSGFKDIIIERMNVSSDFNSPNDFTTFTSETADPLQKIRANQTEERKREILNAITEAAKGEMLTII